MNHKNESALKVLLHIYLLATILFYPFIFLFGVDMLHPFSMVGGHANYYFFMIALFASETHIIFLRRVTAYAMLIVEIIYPIALILFYFLALRKKNYLPFLLLAVFNVIVTLIAVLLGAFSTAPPQLPKINFCMDVIGNAAFCIGYFFCYRKLKAKGNTQ